MFITTTTSRSAAASCLLAICLAMLAASASADLCQNPPCPPCNFHAGHTDYDDCMTYYNATWQSIRPKADFDLVYFTNSNVADEATKAWIKA